MAQLSEPRSPRTLELEHRSPRSQHSEVPELRQSELRNSRTQQSAELRSKLQPEVTELQIQSLEDIGNSGVEDPHDNSNQSSQTNHDCKKLEPDIQDTGQTFSLEKIAKSNTAKLMFTKMEIVVTATKVDSGRNTMLEYRYDNFWLNFNVFVT